jgi:hypothetical protein
MALIIVIAALWFAGVVLYLAFLLLAPLLFLLARGFVAIALALHRWIFRR